MKLVNYSNLELHLRPHDTSLVIKLGSLEVPVHIVWTSKRLRQVRHNPCLSIKNLYELIISTEQYRNEIRKILAIYGRGLCHMNKSSLLLTSYIRSRWQSMTMN